MRLAALSETELVYYLSILRYVAREAGCDAPAQREAHGRAGRRASSKSADVRSRKVSKAAMHLLRVLLNAL